MKRLLIAIMCRLCVFMEKVMWKYDCKEEAIRFEEIKKVLSDMWKDK